jgi:hypothetical protein
MSETNLASPAPESSARQVKRRWWWWRVSFPLGLILAVVAVVGVYVAFEPQYEAAALLEITETPYIAFEPREGGISKAYFQTQIEKIRSPWILGLTAESANVRDLPEIRKQLDKQEWLKNRLKVVRSGDSNIFYIKYASRDPESSRLVANEVTRQYLLTLEDEDAKRNGFIVATLETLLKARREQVRTLRQQVDDAAMKMSVEDPEQEQGQAEPRLAIGKDPLAELQSRLIDVQVERAMLAARIKAREEEVHTADAAATSQNYASAKNDVTAKMETPKPAMYKQGGTGGPPLSPWLNLNKRSPSPVEGGGELATLATQRDELRRLKVELRSCQIAEENLRSEYSKQLEKTLREREQLSPEKLNLKFKKEALAEAQAIVTRINERLISLQTEQSAPLRVIMHKTAETPQSPIEVLPIQKMALAAATGYCFPYVVGFIALVFWNLSLLIARLEPVRPEATGSGVASTASPVKTASPAAEGAPAASAPNAASPAADRERVPQHCT